MGIYTHTHSPCIPTKAHYYLSILSLTHAFSLYRKLTCFLVNNSIHLPTLSPPLKFHLHSYNLLNNNNTSACEFICIVCYTIFFLLIRKQNGLYRISQRIHACRAAAHLGENFKT